MHHPLYPNIPKFLICFQLYVRIPINAPKVPIERFRVLQKSGEITTITVNEKVPLVEIKETKR